MPKVAKTKNSEDRLVWVERSLAKMQADREQDAKERRKAAAESVARAAESVARAAKAEAEWAELRAAIEATNKQIGGFTQGAGDALEEEYIAAVKKEQRIGDIAVLDVYSNPSSTDGQYERDLAFGNGKFIVVAEVKTRFTLADVRKLANVLFPQFAEKCPTISRGRKIIGAIGGGSIPKRVREEAKKLGLLVLRLENRKLVVQNAKGARAI